MAKRLSPACETPDTPEYDIEMRRGITMSIPITYKQPNGAPVDLTGKSIVAKFKNVFSTLLSIDSDDAPTALGSSVTITDALAGKALIKVSDEETLTAILTEDATEQARWWAELHDAGDVQLLVIGDVTVTEV